MAFLVQASGHKLEGFLKPEKSLVFSNPPVDGTVSSMVQKTRVFC